jgi:hypothetical protein
VSEALAINQQLILFSCLCLSIRIVLVIGVALLVLGALPNRTHRMAECGVARHRFLSIGGVLCFVHALVCVVYYSSANAAAREEGRAAGGHA